MMSHRALLWGSKNIPTFVSISKCMSVFLHNQQLKQSFNYFPHYAKCIQNGSGVNVSIGMTERL